MEADPLRSRTNFEIVGPTGLGEDVAGLKDEPFGAVTSIIAGRKRGDMNLKVAHLVSVQFGIFIGIVFCLVFSRFEYFRPRATAERRAPVTERARAVEPLANSEDQTADMVDNDADAELATEQSAPALPNDYSPEAVERYRAEATRLYYEQIAPRRNTSGNPATTEVAAVAPAYTEAVEEPAEDQTNDPAPETVAYVQPTQVIVYPQPVQFVVFSQPRRLANRFRPASPPGALASNPHRRADGGTHLSASTAFEGPASPSSALRPPPGSPGVAHHRNTGLPSCPPTQGFNPRGTR
jgi:hypothetical protein